MTIFEVLRGRHREIDHALDTIERRSSITEARERFHQVAIRILAWLRSTRTVVYPRLVRAPAESGFQLDGDELTHVLRQIAEIERAIEDLRLAQLAEERWWAAIHTLREQVGDFASTEEYCVFPLASLALSSEELRAIAGEFHAYEPRVAAVAGATITYDGTDGAHVEQPLRVAASSRIPARPGLPIVHVPPRAAADPVRASNEPPRRPPSHHDFDPFDLAA